MRLTLPQDSAARKEFPVSAGVLEYFPAAIAGVSRISKIGNDKHNPGEPMHHARGKSMDHKDCIVRHLMDVNDLQASYQRDLLEGEAQDYVESRILEEVSCLAWRALALSQELHERYGGAPLAPRAK
jgi:hypothetical protein